MLVGAYQEAVDQAQANANHSGKPWKVFGYGGAWHCEPCEGEESGAVLTSGMRRPDTTIIYPEFIPFAELKRGVVYSLTSRNLTVGVFDGHGFIGIREKFENRYLDREYAWTAIEHRGTARAKREIGTIPEAIPLSLGLGSECKVCKRDVNFNEARSEGERWRHTDDDTVMCGHNFAQHRSNKRLYAELEKFEKG